MQQAILIVSVVLAFATVATSTNKHKSTSNEKFSSAEQVGSVIKSGWSNSDVLSGKAYDVGSWSSRQQSYKVPSYQPVRRQQPQHLSESQKVNQQSKISKFKSKQQKYKKQQKEKQKNEVELEPLPGLDQFKNYNKQLDNGNSKMNVVKQTYEQLNQTQQESGCGSAKLCCQGKDNTCVTLGRRMNGKNTVTCFCDSVCLPLGDCCTDYQEECPKMDCILGEWGEWSDCDVKCGYGAKQRERKVLVESKNGGKKCEPTVQKQACENKICKQTRSASLMSGGGTGGGGGGGWSGEEMTEIGRIVQSTLSHWRTSKEYDPYKDIRKHIYERNGNTALKNQQPTYCSVYKLIQVHPRCQANLLLIDHSPPLKHDTRVCVECQYTASQAVLGDRCYGHGVYERETRWLSLNKRGCYGTWVKETKKENCLCADSHPDLPSYIFV